MSETEATTASPQKVPSGTRLRGGVWEAALGLVIGPLANMLVRAFIFVVIFTRDDEIHAQDLIRTILVASLVIGVAGALVGGWLVWRERRALGIALTVGTVAIALYNVVAYPDLRLAFLV